MMGVTVTIPRAKMTMNALRKMDSSMVKKQCKILFEEDVIVIPTCLIVLPYELKWNSSTSNLLISPLVENPNNAEVLSSIRKCLLDINNLTARLSFWLMMKKNLSGSDGGVFKSKLKDWLKRVNYEPGEVVAMEMLQDIGCEAEYINVCREVLEKSDAISNAKAYIKDPMGAAREAIKQSTEAIMEYYWSKRIFCT